MPEPSGTFSLRGQMNTGIDFLPEIFDVALVGPMVVQKIRAAKFPSPLGVLRDDNERVLRPVICLPSRNLRPAMACC